MIAIIIYHSELNVKISDLRVVYYSRVGEDGTYFCFLVPLIANKKL
uniref:Uncharacterized protein n=1 Tax=Ciona intestinalis TaxID=7719 RepID=H2XY33_CIOIN